MTVLSDKVTNERVIQVKFSAQELKDILTNAALKEVDLLKTDQMNVKIDIEQETEGSPSYRVSRWHSFVTITINRGA